MNYVGIKNQVSNHKSFYRNFTISKNSDSGRVLIDEPYGLGLLLKSILLYIHSDYDLIIHNVNTWLDIKNTRRKRGFIFTIKRWLRKIILWKAKSIIVVGIPLMEKWQKYSKKNVKYYPFIPPSNITIPSRYCKERIIIVPGSVNRLKRYDRIIKLIEKIEYDEVHFLGVVQKGCDDLVEEIIQSLSKHNRHKVRFYRERIDQSDFDEKMQEAYLIVVDFEENIITTEGYLEVFGQSKESGTFWLAAFYRKPLAAPIMREDIPDINIKHIIV